ncbi:MAG: hypothetical protein GWN67_12680 [Phycisphaerae bacterium]|nr:hypothetical protein [Phycisphaerae bacterium]NIP52964.1 hypothetical protein [Phycisphaerae bacterium]NIS52934.1 hypothetical protein [Phycisphaerae bacterium]NIU09529.1 hypothetical protein [Phycisphaerae bacterium]NIU57199.1 hypothetical protein [Phycisphaerae bacterium]
MKTTRILTIMVVALGLMIHFAEVSEAVPMGTAWTYQGRLMDDSNPADGPYDFQFRLFDDPCTGTQQEGTIEVNDLEVIDGYFTVELDFGSSVFDGDARWLEITIRPGDSNDSNDFATLSPRQKTTPAPYALYAESAGRDNDWTISGNDMYSAVSGNVGIGTTSPSAKLDVEATSGGAATIGSSFNSATGIYAIATGYNTNASKGCSTAMGYNTTASGEYSTAMGSSTIASGDHSTAMGAQTTASNFYSTAMGASTTASGQTSTAMGYATTASGHCSTAMGARIIAYGDYSFGIGLYESPYFIEQDNTMAIMGGNVGIGTTSPAAKLEVSSGTLSTQFTGNDIKFNRDGTAYISNVNTGPGSSLAFTTKGDSGNVRMLIDDSGNVGIGMTVPEYRLDVAGGGARITNQSDGAVVLDLNTERNWQFRQLGTGMDTALELASVDGGGNKNFVINTTGNVGIGTTSPTEELTVRGNILLQSKSTGASILELGEGLDYAEGFDVSDQDKINAGSVLIIDEDNPGKLALSNKSYDTKVAGIVAGGKGLGSGVRLGAGQFDYDVALAGRVYCKVDATDEAIKAGDLLTTSATPGYAMKAMDYMRAQGAILGKAMESLEKGQKGQILVLVTLQ